MPLVVDTLQLWTVGFKWVGRDPTRLWIAIPSEVKDIFSTLLEAILKDQLRCLTLDMRKWDGNDPEIAPFHIRYWLDEIYSGIQRQQFSRKLLRHAAIDREDCKDWCNRCSIPLPEFWFPPGWTDYRYPEHDEATSATEPSSPVEPQSEQAPKVDVEAAPPSDPLQPNPGELRELRPSQRARIACQVIAENIWRLEPRKTIASMCKDERLQLGDAGFYDAETTVKRWVQAVAPADVSAKRGRPKKNTPEDE